MTVEIRVATDEDRDRWNGYVERASQATLCHELAALEAMARHSDTTLYPLIGFVGQEPIGLFPVFERQIGPLSTVFSPPPHIRVPYLGPTFLNLEKLKQRKRERRRERFLAGCLAWIDDRLAPRYGHIRTTTAFPDTRPFDWHGYAVSPEYTYVVDLARSEQDLLESFSSDARRNVRNTANSAYDIEIGGRDGLSRIYHQVRTRYESQGIGFDVPESFVLDLAAHSTSGAVRPYALSVDGEFVGGIIALEHGDTIGRWLGGVRTDADVDVPTNDLLDWAVMTDGRERGCRRYDLIGADTPRINRYKAKFNPALERYHSLECGSLGMRTAAGLYQAVK